MVVDVEVKGTYDSLLDFDLDSFLSQIGEVLVDILFLLFRSLSFVDDYEIDSSPAVLE